MSIIINIKKIIKKFSIIERILSVQIDIKLKWKSHVRKIQKKKRSFKCLFWLVSWSSFEKSASRRLNTCITSSLNWSSSTTTAFDMRFMNVQTRRSHWSASLLIYKNKDSEWWTTFFASRSINFSTSKRKYNQLSFI